MFTELNTREMEKIDGGSDLVVGVLVGVLADAMSKSFTGKGLSDWVTEGVGYVANKIEGFFAN